MSIRISPNTIIGADGWIDPLENWTFSSADGSTGIITVPTDATLKYQPGMRIKLTQTTVKYFIITVVTATLLTVNGGTDYTLANAAISANFYSPMKAPFGFPLDPTKWTVITKNTADLTQASPVSGTWYNLGSLSIILPIGVWNVDYVANAYFTIASGTQIKMGVALSTANNTSGDGELLSYAYMQAPTGALQMLVELAKFKVLAITTKTTYYLNESSGIASMANIYLIDSSNGTESYIKAVNAYL